MKRLWAALIMAIVIAAIIICGLFFIKKYSKEVNDTLKYAAEAANADDMQTAAMLCENAEDKWVNAEKVLRIFVNANELSEIGLTITTLPEYAKNDEKAELLAGIKTAQVQLIHLSNTEATAQ
ncbi:MAG: DUF4363 family protein [Acutalibacteraceae bacterium]